MERGGRGGRCDGIMGGIRDKLQSPERLDGWMAANMASGTRAESG